MPQTETRTEQQAEDLSGKDLSGKDLSGKEKTEKTRRTDRRTLYTRGIIKDALLAQISQVGFEKCTVSSLCREAQIGRATFYLHYDGIPAVLDELVDDALGQAGDDDDFFFRYHEVVQIMKATPRVEDFEAFLGLLPACQRAADHPKYHAMFLDPAAGEYILKRLYHTKRRASVRQIREQFQVSEEQAEALFLFVLQGAFAVNCEVRWAKNQEWYERQKTLMSFLAGGLDALKVKGRNSEAEGKK